MSINNGDVQRRYYHFTEYCQATRPDIIAVQEVSADEGFSALAALAKTLNYQYRFEPIYPGQEHEQGIAIVSNLPITESYGLDTRHGRNKIQVVHFGSRYDRFLSIANIHLEARLHTELLRLRKLGAVLHHLNHGTPRIVTGDFNATPHFPSVRFMKRHLHSAHETANGREPDFTYPTPLGEQLCHSGDAHKFELLALKAAALLFQEQPSPSGLPRMVLDYMFVDRRIGVSSARVIGEDNGGGTFSDHLGLEVALDLPS